MAKGKGLVSVINDSVWIASKLPWWGSFLFGLIAYIILHEVVPMWLESRLQNTERNYLFPLIEVVYKHHLNKFYWVGAACFFAGLIFSIRSLIIRIEANKFERGIIGYIVRVLGRSVD